MAKIKLDWDAIKVRKACGLFRRKQWLNEGVRRWVQGEERYQRAPKARGEAATGTRSIWDAGALSDRVDVDKD
jgi:hypothetical protein